MANYKLSFTGQQIDDALESEQVVTLTGTFQEFTDVLASLYTALQSDTTHTLFTASFGSEMRANIKVVGTGQFADGNDMDCTSTTIQYTIFKDGTTVSSNDGSVDTGIAVGIQTEPQTFAVWNVYSDKEQRTKVSSLGFNAGSWASITLGTTNIIPNFDVTKAYQLMFYENTGSQENLFLNLGVCQSGYPYSIPGITAGTVCDPVNNRAYTIIICCEQSGSGTTRSNGEVRLFRKLRDETNFSEITNTSTLQQYTLYYKVLN